LGGRDRSPGLHFAVGGSTVWRPVRGRTDVSGLTTEAVAAALASAVARDSGLRQRREGVAADYGADVHAVPRAVRRLASAPTTKVEQTAA
jgi:hypothetical protein